MMTQATTKALGCTPEAHAREHGSARIIILVLVFCLIGLVVGAVWFYYRTTKRDAADASGEAGGQQTIALSYSTKSVLKRLESPVEIRFYALLDPASVSAAVQAFAGRLDQLLFAYEREADGKLDVIRYNSRSEISAAAVAAAADGFKPFNLDKGDACYFGLAVAQEGRKESLPELAPEWEQALEFDLTRAIEHVARAKQAAPPPANTPPTDAAAIEEVKRTIPNFAAVSLEEGTRILRTASVNDFKSAVAAMEIQVKEAQERLSQAQNGGSEAERQAALKHLQQVQSEQTAKLKQIAARSAAQIEAFRQLKEAGR
ncbi:MAG: Gldg family protein [Verrucomicrobia bacterium]|nr:Gldg family protein [Verrucomicrobiota bacterium]